VATTSSTSIDTIKDAIKTCEARIESLDKQLKEAQEEQRWWERQLGFATARGLDHFNKCPVEIFIEIFQTYLAPNHLRIRTLLLVCKKWYELVMRTPSLWNRVVVRFPEPSVDRPFGLIPYVEACKKRSGNLKLEVTLDLEVIGDNEEYHNSVLWSLIRGGCADCLFEGLNPNYNYQFDCPIYDQRKEEVIDTVRALVGEGSKDMAKWSTFDLTLPYTDGGIKEIAPALLLLDGPTSSLRSTSIYGLNRWLYHPSDDDIFDRFPGLTDCSSVERLVLRAADIGSIPIQYSSIKHLDIVIDHESDLLSISNLRSLETLDITVLDRRDSEAELSRQENVRHRFLFLHSMKITGYLDNGWFRVLNFDAPLLKNLSVELWKWNRSSTDPFDMKFPQISPRIVTFKAHSASMDSSGELRSWENEELETAFCQVLRHFSSAEWITFRLPTDDTLRKVLLDRTKSGQQCPTVYMERKGDLFRLHHAEAIESS
jgi:hypothetical protein